MTKEDKPPAIDYEALVTRLEAKLLQLEKTRGEQVQELLDKQAELMSDIADLLVRCI